MSRARTNVDPEVDGPMPESTVATASAQSPTEPPLSCTTESSAESSSPAVQALVSRFIAANAGAGPAVNLAEQGVLLCRRTAQLNADEDCVDRELELGKQLGPWAPPFNDCQTFAASVIADCSLGASSATAGSEGAPSTDEGGGGTYGY